MFLEALQARNHDQHRERNRDQDMPGPDGDERERNPEGTGKDEQGNPENDSRYDEGDQHEADDRAAPHEPVAGHRPRRQRAEHRADHGDADADRQAVQKRVDQRPLRRHALVPLDREALEREGDIDGIVEREQRQKQHRNVQKGQIDDRVDQQGIEAAPPDEMPLHATRRVILRANHTMTITERPMVIIELTAIAAPDGQLLAGPNMA